MTVASFHVSPDHHTRDFGDRLGETLRNTEYDRFTY